MQTVENEAYCMILAQACDLPVPEVHVGGEMLRFLMVRRYDRIPSRAGGLVRIHQEDFCQALGYGYDQKYEAEGGPGLKDCFALLSRYSSQPLLDKRNLLHWVIFNFLIGNCDAHSKNISLLFMPEGVKLAPYYDLMSTVIYPELSERLAMKIGGEDRTKWIKKKHWGLLAEEADVSFKAVMKLAKEMATSLPLLAASVEKAFVSRYGAAFVIPKVRHYISRASESLLREIG